MPKNYRNAEVKKALRKSRACFSAECWIENKSARSAWNQCNSPGWLLFAKISCAPESMHRRIVRQYVKACNEEGISGRLHFTAGFMANCTSVARKLKNHWRLPKIENAKSMYNYFDTICDMIDEEDKKLWRWLAGRQV